MAPQVTVETELHPMPATLNVEDNSAVSAIRDDGTRLWSSGLTDGMDRDLCSPSITGDGADRSLPPVQGGVIEW